MQYGLTEREIRNLQQRLSKILNEEIAVDGDYGPKTTAKVAKFQTVYGIPFKDGIVDALTLKLIKDIYEGMWSNHSDLLSFGKRRFVVFVDAGHGGINDKGQYIMKGKQAYHKNGKFHKEGHYYEGLENRIIAEAFCEVLTDAGIIAIRLYHPVKDISLSERADMAVAYLRRGYVGVLMSFHSNAISSKNTLEQKLRTRGFCVYTTRGTTFSDQVATEHFNNVKAEIGAKNWMFRTQKRDGDVDYEKNFSILYKTDVKEFEDTFASTLEEWGFHTSRADCEFITNPVNRKKRVAASLKTAKWVKAKMQQKGLFDAD